MPHNTFTPPTLPDHPSTKDNVDALLLHTVTKLKKLIRCSKERTSYQHLLLPSLSTFVKHMSIQCRLSSTVLVVALIYLARLEQNLPTLACGGKYNSHPLFEWRYQHNMGRIRRIRYTIQDFSCFYLAGIQIHWRLKFCNKNYTQDNSTTVFLSWSSRHGKEFLECCKGNAVILLRPMPSSPNPLVVTPKLTLSFLCNSLTFTLTWHMSQVMSKITYTILFIYPLSHHHHSPLCASSSFLYPATLDYPLFFPPFLFPYHH